VNIPVITIDGPSGSGKGTVSMMLANKLAWNLLDSGSIYRVLALAVLQKKIDLDDDTIISTLAKELPLRFTKSKGKLHIWLDNVEISSAIRTEECGNVASIISSLKNVRLALLSKQRDFLKPPGLVADGRDMGTEVFPHAEVKIFLDASAEIRAKRRFLQLKDKGHNVNLNSLVEDIKRRDERDRNRVVAPLRPATDAIVINTSKLDANEVFIMVLEKAKAHYGSFMG